MEIYEIMPNDWVFHERYGNAKIDWIDNDFGDNPEVKLLSRNIKHKEGYEFGLCYADLDEIFPIPLIEETLVGNGFKPVGDGLYTFTEGKDVFEVSLGEQYTTLTHKKLNAASEETAQYEYSSQMTYKNGCSVQKLQHFMRDCGVDKEIDVDLPNDESDVTD